MPSSDTYIYNSPPLTFKDSALLLPHPSLIPTGPRTCLWTMMYSSHRKGLPKGVHANVCPRYNHSSKLKQQISPGCKPRVVRWYDDDSAGSDEISCLSVWWDLINTLGPKLGYYTNAIKAGCWRRKTTSIAETAFVGTGVKREYPTSEYPYSNLFGNQGQTTDRIIEPSSTNSTPCRLCSSHSWEPDGEQMAIPACMSRTMLGISFSLLPIEQAIRTKFIHSLTGRPPPNDSEWNLIALPARLGGIALANPTQAAIRPNISRQRVTEPLQTHFILNVQNNTCSTQLHPQFYCSRAIVKLRVELSVWWGCNPRNPCPRSAPAVGRLCSR